MKLTFKLFTLLVALTTIGCHSAVKHNLPPASRLFHPGPGVDGPGPGVLEPPGPTHHPFPMGMPGQVPMGLPGQVMGMGMGNMGTTRTVQVLFAGGNDMSGMQLRWDVGGGGEFDSVPLVVPGRNEFPEGGIYRLKLTNIPGHEGSELYPTLEVGPTTPRTEAYLAHNAIPIQFTPEDFDQVETGNFVTKVIYLPDAEFQELALAGAETLVSTRLDPGVDPIKEADRRGSILSIVRLGNKDVEMPQIGVADNNVVPAGFGHPMMTMTPHGPMMVAPQMVAPHPQMAAIAQAQAMQAQAMQAQAMQAGPSQLGMTGIVPNYVSGVTAPQWGHPITGTPIGIPGGPHIPLGGPAGLRQHVMKNRTPMHLPQPNKRLNITVRQQPGFSYPRPPSHMRIREQAISPAVNFGVPHKTTQQLLP